MVGPATDLFNQVIFYPIYTSSAKTEEGEPVLKIPFILVWLGGAALFFTFYFKFINFRAFGLALRTVRENTPREMNQGKSLTSRP